MHQELAKRTRTAKDIATTYKNAKKATVVLHTQWSEAHKENEALTARLQQTEDQLKAEQVPPPTDNLAGIPHVPDKELWQQLRTKEREVDSLTQREELAEENFKNLHELCEMVKTIVGKFIDEKKARIHQLKDQMYEFREAKKAETKKVDTLERLLKIKDDQYFTTGA